MDNPFTLKVYDAYYNFRGFIGNPRTVVATPRFNLGGTLRIDLPIGHRMVEELSASGARVVCLYHDEHMISGPVTSIVATGPSASAFLTFYIDDDLRIFDHTLGLPPPATGATSTAEYYKLTGPAETVVKTVFNLNVNGRARVGLPPVTIATDHGRGDTISVQFRYEALSDVLFPAVTAAGIGVSIKQIDGALVLDCFVPTAFKQTLTEASGAILDWNWTSTRALGNSQYIGGPGDGVARFIHHTVDNAPTGASYTPAVLNDVMEYFSDARGFDDPPTANQIDTNVAANQLDHRDKSGFALKLAETETFRYGGEGLHIGDLVTVNIGGADHTDVLKEVTISFTRDNGLTITPTVGDIDNNPDRTIAKFLKNLRQGLSQLKAGK